MFSILNGVYTENLLELIQKLIMDQHSFLILIMILKMSTSKTLDKMPTL